MSAALSADQIHARIGHWDAPEMNGVLQEACELVKDSLLNEEEFAEFV